MDEKPDNPYQSPHANQGMAGQKSNRWHGIGWAEVAAIAIIAAILAALLIPEPQMGTSNEERDQKRWEQWKRDQESAKDSPDAK
jgi:hypothetical protein